MVATAERSKRVRVVNRKLIPLSRLKNAKHNPKHRTEPKFLRGLMDSLDMIGQLHPVTVTPGNVIIDGHRRVAAARLLKWNDIEANIVEEDAATVYRSVNNGSARRLSGNDTLNVWLIEPNAVPVQTSQRIAAMRDYVGEKYVEKIADAGYSLKMYTFARQVARYCEIEDEGNTKAIIDWLISTTLLGQVQKAVESKAPPKVILEAIRKNKPLVFRAAVGD